MAAWRYECYFLVAKTIFYSIGVWAIFGQGGGKPFAQMFTKQSKTNEGHTMQQHRPHWHMKVPRHSFSGSIPAKFEHKLCRHKQTFGKIATTVVLDKDENLSWSGLQWHRSCHSNEMTPLPIILAALFLTMKSFLGAFSSNSRLDVREVKTESVRALSGYFGIKFLSLEIQ